MRYITSFFVFIFFILVLGIALKNAEAVELHYYLGYSWSAPLSLMLLITFFIGIVVGVIACISTLIRQRRQLLALKHELKTLSSSNA